jgi:diguanylate cyclase (GGDEF)-like protein
MASDYGLTWIQPVIAFGANGSIDSEQLLNQLVGQIRDARQVSELLTGVVEPMRRLLDVDRTNFYQLDNTDQWEVIAEAIRDDRLPALSTSGLPAYHIPPEQRELLRQQQWLIVDTQAGKTAFYHQPAITREYLHHQPNHPSYEAEFKTMGVVSCLLVPIVQQNHLWGVLACHHRQSKRFSHRQLQTIQILIDQISIGVAQAQLVARARLQNHQDNLIQGISKLLVDLDPINTESLLAELATAFQADGARLYTVPAICGELLPVCTHGQQPSTSIDIEQNALWQKVMYERQPGEEQHRAIVHAVSDIYQQASLEPLYFALNQAKIRSMLLIPLAYNHQCVGCLTLFRQENTSYHWTDAEVQTAQALTIHLYTAVMQQRVESMFRHQSYYDALTTLPNRWLFQQRLTLALAKSQETGTTLTVIFFDIDRFKTINDSLGHTIGDQLLQMVANRLQRTLRPGDVLARWSGDEFAFLITSCSQPAELAMVCDTIFHSLAAPFEFAESFPHLQSNYLHLQGTMGIAVSPYDGEDTEILLQHANAALCLAQQHGVRYEAYSSQICTQAMQRLRIENILYQAIDSIGTLNQERFFLHYQPQISLINRQVIGVEALLRCYDSEGKFVSPLDFIPVAEENGSIEQIGEWVLINACKQNKRWQDEGLGYFPIAVNLSVKQIQQSGLVKAVQRALTDSGLAAQYLEVEITESIAISNLELAVQVLKEIRSLGVQVSLDDFGTGHSSLAALKHLPLDRLKIDRSFIKELTIGSIDAGIVRMVINLGRELKLEVIAEGVETLEQLQFLESVQCDAVQGYFFSKPLPAHELAGLINNGHWVK